MAATVPGNARVHNIRPIVIELVVPINEGSTRGPHTRIAVFPCRLLQPAALR